MYPGTHALTQPDKIALIRPATGETLTYRQLDARSNQLAQLLHARGLRRGDHVALFADNVLPFFEIMAACQRSGLYLTAINRYLSPEEAAYIVDDCDARVLIASSALEQAEALGKLAVRSEIKLAIGDAVPGFEDYETALATQPAEKLAQESMGALMLYSSGTTGRPKGIRRPLPDTEPQSGNAGSRVLVDTFNFDKDSIYLSPAPMYHGAPIGFTLATLQMGGTVVMMDRFDAELALALIEKYRITHSQWVPAMFIRMLKLPDDVRSKYDLSSLKCAVHAAAPCPIDVKHAMIDWWGPVIEEYYNSTEGAGFTHVRSEDWLTHPGTVGRSRGAPLHVCDEEGNELPPGTPGYIYGESPTGTPFVYHKDEGKTVGAIHPEHKAWLTVGDIGYLDADGYLFLTDRKAFMIISGGVNIYPQQIENVLAMHPKVGDIAVIGVPHEELGEEVKAVVEPAPGVVPSEDLAQEIKDFVREKLGKQLTPRSVDFVDALPRLPTGKLYKKALRDQYWGEVSATTSLSAR